MPKAKLVARGKNASRKLCVRMPIAARCVSRNTARDIERDMVSGAPIVRDPSYKAKRFYVYFACKGDPIGMLAPAGSADCSEQKVKLQCSSREPHIYLCAWTASSTAAKRVRMSVQVGARMRKQVAQAASQDRQQLSLSREPYSHLARARAPVLRLYICIPTCNTLAKTAGWHAHVVCSASALPRVAISTLLCAATPSRPSLSANGKII